MVASQNPASMEPNSPQQDGATSALSELERSCARRGLRLTGQRRVVMRVLADSADHPDVEELHRRARRLDPHISLVTVYRTVKLLEEANILEKRRFGGVRARYESSDAHHDHLIDVTSGRVLEFRDDAIERLQVAIARRMGYELVGHKLELFARPLKSGESGESGERSERSERAESGERSERSD